MEIRDIVIEQVDCHTSAFNKDINICRISWSANIGFGELAIRYDNIGNTTVIDTEYMGKEFAKQVLCKLIDEADEVKRMDTKLQRLRSASYQLYKFKQQYKDLLYLYPGIEIGLGEVETSINYFIKEEELKESE
jgi:hypothetical protein